MNAASATLAFLGAFYAVFGALASFSAAAQLGEALRLPRRYRGGTFAAAAFDAFAAGVMFGAAIFAATFGA